MALRISDHKPVSSVFDIGVSTSVLKETTLLTSSSWGEGDFSWSPPAFGAFTENNSFKGGLDKKPDRIVHSKLGLC